MKINLGYCCISTIHKEIRCNRASTKTYLESLEENKRGFYLITKAKENLSDLAKLLLANYSNDIHVYRIPEQLLPQIDLAYYSLKDVKEELKKAGKFANDFKVQLSTHPSQYFVLNSIREEVVSKTIYCLNLYADMFALMELEKTPNITLHVGVKNAYETVDEAIDIFCRNFHRLNQNAKKYLVIENDHVSFNVDHCLSIHEKIGIPVVFDNRHYHWNKGDFTFEESVKKCVRTWGIKRTPKLHLSSENELNRHAHSEFVDLADYLELERALINSNIKECNVMLECKQKDFAVLKLREQLSDIHNR